SASMVNARLMVAVRRPQKLRENPEKNERQMKVGLSTPFRQRGVRSPQDRPDRGRAIGPNRF
ncbi:MAG: hypothetical protein J7521_23560, partial [Caulobacter sp.]|nr:hypothetical protein [Caulobacter sp.]